MISIGLQQGFRPSLPSPATSEPGLVTCSQPGSLILTFQIYHHIPKYTHLFSCPLYLHSHFESCLILCSCISILSHIFPRCSEGGVSFHHAGLEDLYKASLSVVGGRQMEKRLPGPDQIQELLQTGSDLSQEGALCVIGEISSPLRPLVFSLQDKIDANFFC